MPVVSFDYIEKYEQQAAEIERLRAALRPFADFGEIMLPQSPNDNSPWVTCPDETPVNNIGRYDFTFGMFRAAARAALDDK